MGTTSRQSYAATFPRDRFYCLLDDLPTHLIPQGARRSTEFEDSDRPLVRNPECVFCRDGELPEGVAPETVSGLALQGTIAWVRQAGSAVRIPFWLSPEMSDLVRDYTEATISPDIGDLLRDAGILIPAGFHERSGAAWERRAAKSQSLFRERGYAPIAGLIHPFHVAALRRYYRFLIRTGRMELGDKQSLRRYVAYNDSVARFFHHQITATLSVVAGEPLKPSYVYLASYLGGAELKKHIDREQCEYSVTFCLDFSPEPMRETSWPIRLDTPRGTATVYQALGDGLAYRGTRLPHYRDILGDGQTSTSIFFHYVRTDFSGPLG